MKNGAIIALAAIAVLFLAFFTLNRPAASNTLNINGEVTLFKSMSCGCCSVYASYMQKKGISVSLPEISDVKLNEVKDSFKIPSNLRSCHTTMYGNYFVEGHVPLEAVEKLLAENPDIAGIAMPGMQMGSPGMSGSKSGQFVIYAVNRDGTYSEFMRI